MQKESTETKLSPALNEFASRVLWRYDNFIQRFQAGEKVESGDGAIQHGLDMIDFTIRTYLISEFRTLRAVNEQIRRHNELLVSLKKPLGGCYEETFWILVDAYTDAVELELFEMVPKIRATLQKLTKRHFAGPEFTPLRFPEDLSLNHWEQALYAHGYEVAPDQDADHTPLEQFFRYYEPPRLAYAVSINATQYWQDAFNRLDFIDFHTRRYIAGYGNTLHRVYKEINDFLRDFPEIAQDQVTAYLQSLKTGTLIPFELYELMPRYDTLVRKVSKKFRLVV